MAASVSNLTRPLDLSASALTRAVVAGADQAIIDGFTSGSEGINGSSASNYFENGGTATVTDDWYSAWAAFSGSAVDMSATDTAFVCHYRVNSSGFNNVKAIRMCLRSGTGTANWGIWEFTVGSSSGNDGFYHPCMMFGTPDSTVGTFDNTDVTGFAFQMQASNTDVFAFACHIDQLVFIDGPATFEDTGGAATVELEDYFDLVEQFSTQDYRSQLAKKAGPTFEFGFPVKIASDDYNSTAVAEGIAFKEADDFGYPAMPSGFFQLLLECPASGTQVFDNFTAATNSTAYDLTIDGTAASSSLTVTNGLFAGVNDTVVDGANVTLTSCTIASPATADIADGDLDLTITGSTAAIDWTADLVSGSSLTTDSDIDITFAETDLSDITLTLTASNTVTVSPTTGSGTYDLSGLTTTGTVELDNSTANNTTITLPSGTSNTVASPTAGGGSITVDSPSVTFTINSSESSSLIQIFTQNTQTVLDSTTGSSLAFVHSGQTVDYVVQKAGFLPQRVTGVTLSGTSSVTVNLVEDPIYNASNGLSSPADYSYDASTRILTIVANQEGRDLYSALIDDFISETAYRNCPFPITAIGPDRFDFNAIGYYNTATTVGATIDSGDIQFWKGAGMEWEHDTTGNPTKKFYSIKSSNTLQASSVVGYTQVLAGTPSEATLVSNQVNQVIQYFEDTNGDGTPDYNYTSHLLFKGFLTGYYQARWDVINDGGVSTLESYEYNIALTQDAIAGTTGDQSVTITTLTDHASSPISVGGKNFDYELVDPGTTSAENLLAQHNYNVYNAVNTSISGSLYTSYTAFDLPDLVVEAGANYETERGYFEGDGAVTDLSGVYLSRSSADHPDIARFQSNDGTYYTPATVAQVSAPNLTAGRVQLVNETGRTASAWAATTAYSLGDKVLRSTGAGTERGIGLYFQCTTAGTTGGSEPTWNTTLAATTSDGTVTWTCRDIEIENTTNTSGYSYSWTDGEEADAGDTLRLRWIDSDEDEIEATGIATAAGTTSFLNTPVDDDVYDGYGIDGSTVTEYTADFPNVEVDVNDPDNIFYIDRFYAWWKYNLTTADGIRNFFGGVTAIDTSNITINNSVVDIFFDNTKATSARQGDNIVIQRSDGAYPQVTTTSGGGGLGFYYTGIGYSTSSGSGLDTTERNKLLGLYDYDPTTNTLEGSTTYQEAQRIMLAESAGQVSVSGSTVTFRDQADTKDRITATVDSNGQRTSVTVDGS